MPHANSAAEQFSVNTGDYSPHTANPYDAGSDFTNGLANFFTFGYWNKKREATERANDAYNAKIANALEESRLTSARNYEMYMDSTKYQRAVKDAEAAGLNPLLLFGNSLNTSAGASASAIQSHTPQSRRTKANGSSSIISSALKLLAILALK